MAKMFSFSFFFFFLIPSLWRVFYIIQVPLDHLDPTFVDHLSPYLSVYPIRHLLWLSVSCGNQGSTVQGFSPHKCGQKSSCSTYNAVVVAFPQIFFGFPSFSYVHDARPYHWSFLKGHPNCQDLYLICVQPIRGDIPHRTTFPFVSYSLSPESEPFITIRSFSDYSRFRPRFKAQYMIWALNPTAKIKINTRQIH